MNRQAIIRVDGWAGQRTLRVYVVGETPQRYRVTPAEGEIIMLPGRPRRYLKRGETKLVAKHVVEFVDGEPTEFDVQLPKLIQVAMTLEDHNFVVAAIGLASRVARLSKPGDEFIPMTPIVGNLIHEFVTQSYDANDPDGLPVFSRAQALLQRIARMADATWGDLPKLSPLHPTLHG